MVKSVFYHNALKNIEYFFPGNSYQDSKDTGRWVYWDSVCNWNCFPEMGGSNFDTDQAGKLKS